MTLAILGIRRVEFPSLSVPGETFDRMKATLVRKGLRAMERLESVLRLFNWIFLPDEIAKEIETIIRG
jgi:hypothetical protein